MPTKKCMILNNTMKRLSEEMKTNRSGWWGYCHYCKKDFFFKEKQIIKSFDLDSDKIMCPYCYCLLEISKHNI